VGISEIQFRESC